MTVAVNDTIERYVIAGAGPYAYTWRIFNDTDLQVYALSTASPPVPTLLTYLTHYTVAGANDAAGGSITLTAAAIAAYTGFTLDIRANTPDDQPTSIRNIARFLPEIHEDAYDYLSRQIQDLRRLVNASIRYPDNESISGVVETAASRKGFYLVWDSITGALTKAAISTVTMTQSIIGQLLNPQTPAEAAAGVVPVNYWYSAGNILRYGGDPTGVASSNTAGQAMLSQRAQGGAPCYVPTGTYKQTVAWVYPLSTVPLHLYGDGMFSSVITTALNIENLNNAGADATHGMPDPYIHDISFYNTFPVVAGAGATSFNIHLQNPLNARIQRVYCKSNFQDTDFNANNHAGVWLERVGGYGAAFQNLVSESWIQNGQINMGTSDSAVTLCICWGHPCDYAIKADSTNVAVHDNYDLTGSRNHGAVWLTTNATLCRVTDNFFDGAQGAVNSGFGVWADQQIGNFIEDNIFWTMTKAAVWLVNPSVFTVSGNIFFNCGSQDTGNDDSDVVLQAVAFASNNIATNNQHFRSVARVNPAYAVFEKNSGAAPQANRIAFNSILDTAAQYQTAGILAASNLFNSGSVLIGNVGKSAATEVYSAPAAALTLSGCTTAPTVTPRISRQGNLVEIYVPAVSANSNSTSCKLTGVPTAFRPANTARGGCIVTSSGNAVSGFWAIDSTGDITLYRVVPATGVVDSAGFVNDGLAKGVIDGLTLNYPLT